MSEKISLDSSEFCVISLLKNAIQYKLAKNTQNVGINKYPLFIILATGNDKRAA